MYMVVVGDNIWEKKIKLIYDVVYCFLLNMVVELYNFGKMKLYSISYVCILFFVKLRKLI